MDDRTKALVADTAPIIMALHDLDHNIQWANDAYCKATGLEPLKIKGMKCWRAWGLNGICRGCPVVTAIETGQSAEAELTPQNQEHWPESQGSWLSKATPIRDSDGKIVGVVEVGLDITERIDNERLVRAANQQLQSLHHQLSSSEKRFRQIYERTPVGIAQVSLDMHIELANPAYCRMLGYTEEELIGKHLSAVTHPEILDDNLKKQTQLAAGEIQNYRMDKTFIHKDGHAVYAILEASLVRDEQERPACCLGTVVDITQKKRAEQTPRRFDWLNNKEQLDPPQTKDTYLPPYENVTALNTCHVIAKAVNKKAVADMGRDLMDLLDTSVTVYEANGDYAFGQFDSTWCRLLDSASFKRCKTDDTQKALRCGAWLCHENCWNDSAKVAMLSGAPTDIECVGGIRLYGVPIVASGEIVGAVNIGYGTPPTNEDSMRALADRFALPLEEIRAAAQAYKPRPQFIIDVAKRRCRTVARMIGDAVEKKRLEAQLAQSDRLSTMGTLAAGVAHEINNPLAYTLYNLETVVEELPDIFSAYQKMMASGAFTPAPNLGPEQLNDFLDRAREALGGAQRIHSISKTLGTFARVDDTEDGPIDIRHAAEHARNMAHNETKYRAKLLLDLSPVPLVVGSEGKMAQVFLNLLINAAHAIDEGDVEGNTIRIRTYSEGDRAVAEVSDTGKGIPKETMARLFEPFFTTKPIGEGSGLGLSVSQKIILEMGGDITCKSEEGRGTTFRIRLPAMRSENEERLVEKVSVEPTTSSLQGRFLVVDDEPGIREIISHMLRRENHEVLTAASGAVGKEILAIDQDFDAIILDLMMPKVSGMDLHRWLAEHHLELADRVIFVTGGVFTPRAQEYLSKVDNMRLEKPLDAGVLKKAVGEMIDKRMTGKSQ